MAKPHPLDMERKARESREVLDRLLAPSPVRGRGSVLADMIYRSSQPSAPDGYGGGALGEYVSGGGTGNATQSAAFSLLDDVCPRCTGGVVRRPDGQPVTCKTCSGSGRRWADPIADAVEDLLTRLVELSGHAAVIDRRRAVVMSAGERRRGRESALQGTCDCCTASVSGVGEDRLRRGYCTRCYKAWLTWRAANESKGDPGEDRLHFVTARREQIRAQAETAELDRLVARKELPQGGHR